MQSYGKLSNTQSIICMNHALHLAVMEIFIKRKKDDLIQFIDKYKDIIKNIRSIVHTFKKSPKFEQILSENIQQNMPNTRVRKLIIDCSTRWNTLVDMLERFCLIFHCVETTLQEVNKPVTVTHDDILLIRSL